MNNKMIMKIALEQSSADYSVDVEKFDGVSFSIVEPKTVSLKARNYLKQTPYCNFVYYGQTLVAIVNQDIKSYITNLCERYKQEIYRLFDAPQITSLNNELEKHGKCIAHLAEYFLPDVTYIPDLNQKITTVLLEGDELLTLYNDKRFSMALSYTREPGRRDEIAMIAYVDGKIAGVAGASNDSSTMWQIGIDVLKEHRHQKIASTLTYLLSQEILKKGIVPFYCCAWSNVASKNTARKAGFRHAWVELTAKNLSEEWIKKIRDNTIT